MDRGGAANGTIRLHQALNELGVNSSMLCLHRFRFDIPNEYKVEYLKPPGIIKRQFNRIGLFQSLEEKHRKELKKLKAENAIFTFPDSDNDITRHPLVILADIVHLHWIGNFVDIPSFFTKIKKPVVWTLHDRNPILGGFHIEMDRLTFPQLVDLDNRLRVQKMELYEGVNNLTLIVPSLYHKKVVEESTIFEGKKIEVIPNVVDSDLFTPFDKTFSRKVLALPGDSFIGLFICHHRSETHKGFNLLKEWVDKLNDPNFLLAVVGEGFEDLPHDKYISLGKITDERLMPLIYSAADVFFFPSLEESFGNVILESLACGTPVISNNVGGAKDVILKPEMGFIMPANNLDALTEGYNDIKNQLLHKGNLLISYYSSLVRDQNSYTAIGKNMIAVYKEILSS
jgi:glycosyltransferase involved in cell wall biosynthesis